jgi:hypothetical protein
MAPPGNRLRGLLRRTTQDDICRVSSQSPLLGLQHLWMFYVTSRTIALVLQALSLFDQVSKKATYLPVWLIFKAIFAMGRAFNVPDKVFAATCPMLHLGCRLAGLGGDLWVAYPYLKAFGKVVPELRRARTVADFFRALATGSWTSLTTWLARALRGILLRVAALMILPFLLYLMFHL